MRAERVAESEREPERKRNCAKKWFRLHFTQWHKRWTNRPGSWSWSRCCQRHIRCSLTNESNLGGNPIVGLLLKWFPQCPADEELTSSGTMVEWEKDRGCHRPGDKHTMVFDRKVMALSGEDLRPGPGSGDRVDPGLQESPCGRVRFGRLALELDTCSRAPLCGEISSL